MSIVMLCVEADMYAGIRARAFPADPASGIVILRFVVVEAGPAEAELLAGGTAWPAPPEHAAKPATSSTGKQRFISATFGGLRFLARSPTPRHGLVGAGTKYARMDSGPDDRLGVLIAPPAIAELSNFFGTTDYLSAVQIFRATRMLSARMNEASTGWLAPHGLTPAQYNFMAVIFLQGRKAGISSRDIGKSMHTTSGTVTSMTDTLEQNGLVERVPHPSDRRSLVLRLTRKGERRFAKAAQTHHDMAVAAMSALSAAEMQTLLELIVRAGNSLGAALAPAAEPGEKAG